MPWLHKAEKKKSGRVNKGNKKKRGQRFSRKSYKKTVSLHWLLCTFKNRVYIDCMLADELNLDKKWRKMKMILKV